MNQFCFAWIPIVLSAKLLGQMSFRYLRIDLIPIVISAKFQFFFVPNRLGFALIPIVLSAKFSEAGVEGDAALP